MRLPSVWIEGPVRLDLFISQLLVFLVFPLYKKGARWWPLVAVASGLMAWGFYQLVAGTAST